MVIERDDPFAFEDYYDCMALCPFDPKTCHELCQEFDWDEVGDG